MNLESAALGTILFSVLCAVALVWRDIQRCADGLGVWLLYHIDLVYMPFVFHLKTNRRCPYPDDQAALIVANHRSPVDPLFVWMNHHLGGTSFRTCSIRFIMAREYYEQPGLIGWISRTVKAVPIERDGRDMEGTRQALRQLRAGHLVAIFPEGRINKGDALLPANPGVAFLALRAKVPVYPVYIEGAPPPGKSMVAPFCTFSRVRVYYGDPIDLSEYYHRKNTQELLDEVTSLLMGRVAELGGHETPEMTRPLEGLRIVNQPARSGVAS